MSDDVVYVAPNSNGKRRVYHDNPECVGLRPARKVMEKPAEVIVPHKRGCKRCVGSPEESTGKDGDTLATRRALIKADPDTPLGGDA